MNDQNTTNPWDSMRPMLLKLGYTDDQIDEMTFAELQEILDQEE